MSAYVIAVADTADRDGHMKEYAPRAVKIIEAAGGKFLVRGGKTGGNHPPTGRVVVIQVEGFEEAEAFNSSIEWQELNKTTGKYTTISSYIVDGLH